MSAIGNAIAFPVAASGGCPETGTGSIGPETVVTGQVSNGPSARSFNCAVTDCEERVSAMKLLRQ